MKYIKALLFFAGGLWVILFLIVNLILPIVPSENWCAAAVFIPLIAFIVWGYYVFGKYHKKYPAEEEERYL